MIKTVILYAVLCLGTSGCAQSEAIIDSPKEENITVTIVGSAEHPDPVLERVKILEQQGVLSVVAVMESFPVQIRLTGPIDIVEELRTIPRKK